MIGVESQESLSGAIRSLQSGNKPEAIRIFRVLTGASLAEANRVVEAIAQGKAVEITDLIMSELAGGRSLGALDAEGRIPPPKGEQVQMSEAQAQYPLLPRHRLRVFTLFMLVFGLLIVSAVIAVLINLRGQEMDSSGIPMIRQILPSSTPSFASSLLSFGEEGMGAGMLNDPRSIGVNSRGDIYVGDYNDGRIQIFDSRGTFLKLVSLGNDTYIAGLVVAPDGSFYACVSGQILPFNPSGQELQTPVYDVPSGMLGYIDSIALGADGSLYAATSGEAIFRFGPGGEINLTIQDAFTSVTDHPELDMHLAVDGLGNIYVLGTFNNLVLKYSPEGKYLDRFGGETQHPAEGVDPGRFQAPDTIAVDGYGRIYVSDIWGIQVFDTNGQYLDFFGIDGVAFGMAFGLDNNLYIASSTPNILKYQIQKP